MSGMGSTLQLNNATVVGAFRSALLHQGIIALLIFFLLAMLWVSVREWVPGSRISFGPAAGDLAAEPRGRQVLRIGFGVLWILDGLLQAQPAMPLGLASNVTQPSADGSPGWVRSLVDFAARGWTYHPVNAAAAAVWIQIGIGIWLLTAARGPWSRLGGVASVGWGLVVWIFGEAFGGIFAPGLSWLFGAPGAALLYAVAGALIALPDRAWAGQRLGRAVLAATGVFLAGMALLQAWPGRGFWQGTVGRQPGNLASMAQGMAQTAQPGFLSSWVNGFGTFAAAHGFAVNLVVVAVLAAAGLALASGQRAVLRPALGLLLVLCAADWVLVQDLGVFGGLGTDPNSMIPFALVAVGGYLAVARAPSPAIATAPADGTAPAAGRGRAGCAGDPAGQQRGWRDRIRPRRAGHGDRQRQPAHPGRRRRPGCGHHRRHPDGRRVGQRQRLADPRAGARRVQRAAGLQGARLHAHQPARPYGQPGQPAREGGPADLPRPGLHVRLPADRPGIPAGGPVARRAVPAGRTGRGGHQPVYNQPAYTAAFDRQEHMATPAQLAVPDRQRRPAQDGVAAVRDRGPDPARGRDDRAQRSRVRHRPVRAGPAPS